MPWLTAHAKLHRTLHQRGWLPLESRVLVAVSGGQDSLCLVRLLVDLCPRWRWYLGVVHCNHRWRPDAAANAAHVAKLAQAWGLPCWVKTASTLPQSEAAARQWRYGVFEVLAGAEGFTQVVTGHTATDRAETLLYNLLRGSGTDGLQALQARRSLSPNTSIQLVRPLIEFTRAETGAVCEALQLPVWEDTTNADRRYRRNRIRAELMPYLRSHFNPKVEASLAQTAELLTAEVAYLTEQTDRLYAQVVTRAGENWALQRDSLHQAPVALQRRVVRRLLQQVMPRQPNFDHIEKLRRLAVAPHRSQSDPFPGGQIAQVEGPLIVLRSAPE